MKYFFLLCLVAGTFLSAPISAQHQKGWVYLKGSLKNFNNQIEVEDMSEMKELMLPDPSRFFVPDSAGHFQLRFELNEPNYFRLGRNILYLSPGDSLNVFVDKNKPADARFEGKHHAENEYLCTTPFPKGGSFLEAGTHIKSTVDSTVTEILSEAEKRTKLLAISATGLSRTFIKLESARIRADILNSMLDISSYFPYKRKLAKDSADNFRKNFPVVIAPYLAKYDRYFIDPEFLKLVVYRDIADHLVSNEKTEGPSLAQIKMWMAASAIAEKLKAAGDRQTKLAFQKDISAIKNPVYRAALQNTLDRVLQLSNGDLAVDFTAADLTNKLQQLSKLKGKVIYIDIWATWCGPCMEEMPAFEKLKEAFTNRPEVSFVSLSIDDDKDAWQKSVNSRKAQGLQWIIDRTRLQAYNIIGIPRTIVIDRNFSIADINAALPSSAKAKELIGKLLE